MTPPEPFYLTTPIYYVNARPHLGHAYTTIAADAMCRYRRLTGAAVHFLTGTDEHGDNIARAAAKAGVPPQAYADEVSAAFRATWGRLGISNDDFIRTTEPRHQRVVQAILQTLYDRGEIYFGKYGGLYCFGCERFYTDKEAVDGACPQHLRPLEFVEEENYFFKMSKYQDWLVRYLEAHPALIRPERHRNEVLGFLREPLQDLSISRPKTRLTWGVPLPFDERFVTYVWFDALINYVSALGGPGADAYEAFWPHAWHLIGKDILKPHGVYWPCMLRAAGLPVYAGLVVHGYWTLGGGKMSKSVGNVVEALALADRYGRDAFRYFLLREMTFGLDANFSEEGLIARLNADLANDLGNLVSRATTMIANFGTPGASGAGDDDTVRRALATTAAGLAQAMDEFQFQRALTEIWEFIRVLNGYVDRTKPWELAKDPAQRRRLDAVLLTLADALGCLGILLDPFLPDAAARIRAAVGRPGPVRLAEAVLGRVPALPRVEKLSGLFPRIETRQAAAGGLAPGAGPGPARPRIAIDEFARIELRVAQVLAAEPVKGSKKLLKLVADVGEPAPRTIVAGIAEHYAPAELVGKKVVVVANLEPARLMGVDSDGMLLAGSTDGRLAVLSLDRDLPPGARVT